MNIRHPVLHAACMRNNEVCVGVLLRNVNLTAPSDLGVVQAVGRPSASSIAADVFVLVAQQLLFAVSLSMHELEMAPMGVSVSIHINNLLRNRNACRDGAEHLA
jgi:hypothetical protein